MTDEQEDQQFIAQLFGKAPEPEAAAEVVEEDSPPLTEPELLPEEGEAEEREVNVGEKQALSQLREKEARQFGHEGEDE